MYYPSINPYNVANEQDPYRLNQIGGGSFFPFPGGPPSGPPPFSPGGPSGGPPPFSPGGPSFPPDFGGGQGGDTYGPPSGPPPGFTPQLQGTQGQQFAVDPGSMRRCRFRYTYVWLRNGNSFWFYPTFIGRTSVAGWRWRNFRWVYYGTDADRISAFQCT